MHACRLRRHGKLQFSDRPCSKSTTVTKQQEMAPDISSEGDVELTAIGKEDSANVDNDDYFEDTSLMGKSNSCNADTTWCFNGVSLPLSGGEDKAHSSQPLWSTCGTNESGQKQGVGTGVQGMCVQIQRL